MNKDQKLIAEAYEEVVKNQETTFQPGDRVKIADTHREYNIHGKTGTVVKPTVIKKSKGYNRKVGYIYDKVPGYEIKMDDFYSPKSKPGFEPYPVDTTTATPEELIPV